jgi:hypothetical protein
MVQLLMLHSPIDRGREVVCDQCCFRNHKCSEFAYFYFPNPEYPPDHVTQNVSDLKVGVSDINTEIISGANDQFVLHNNQGFEPGEDNNFEIVKDFIESRSPMPDLKDKIHAIW